MSRDRIIALSTIVLLASGAAIFACSGDDTGTDGGADAKADQTSNKDSGSDAGKDGSPFSDGGQDATVQDSGNDATLQDATTTDATDDGAADGATMDDGAADAMDDGGDGGTATTFMVLRVGGDVDAGADASFVSGTAYQTYLEERNVSDGSVVRTIALPTAMNGTNQPFTISGSSTSEGSLARSGDGHYVVIAGYAATPGTTGVTTSATDAGVLRVVARVDKSGNVDTTTVLDAFSKKTPRGATSNDGTSFWMTGAGNGGEGTQYATLGSTGANVNIESFPSNTRVVQIFGGQLYISSGSSPNIGVLSVGTGLPTASGQTAVLLSGFAGDAGGSPYGFSMLDLDGSVNGLDTLYVADDASTTGGVQKWVYNGTTWTKIATFNSGTTKGFRSVTAFVSGSNVVVLGTTGDGSPNSVIEYVDDGVNTTPTGTVLATAPTNTVFRGIALPPN